MRGPVISNDRHKQTSVRNPTPQNPIAPGVRGVQNIFLQTAPIKLVPRSKKSKLFNPKTDP